MAVRSLAFVLMFTEIELRKLDSVIAVIITIIIIVIVMVMFHIGRKQARTELQHSIKSHESAGKLEPIERHYADHDRKGSVDELSGQFRNVERWGWDWLRLKYGLKINGQRVDPRGKFILTVLMWFGEWDKFEF